MTLTFWLITFLTVQVVHYLGTSNLYTKAGRKSWEAAIPFYNAYVLMKIINRPTYWALLLFIPVINLVVFPVIWVETLRSFGKKTTKDTWLGILSLGLYIFTVNYDKNATYIINRDLTPKSETVSSLLFAVVVATLVHTYVMQPYTIPTSSLEKSLLVGDFLFVSKFHYGARTPMTPVALPMVHDTIPKLNTKSYVSSLQLPYFRFPALEKIKRTDIVVFNWPTDTVRFFRDTQSVGIRKPIDKKSNYVKRCVGTPGDSLSIVDGIIHINNKELQLPERAKPQYSYTVTSNGSPLNLAYFESEFDITDPFGQVSQTEYRFAALTEETAQRLKSAPNVVSVERIIAKEGDNSIFPHANTNWSVDNFGPIYIPEAGKTVSINKTTLPFYKMIISEYEGNDLKVIGNNILINGKPSTTYTFKQDYYWMMGDNRHNSEDSRYWGYVPADHIVGKPVFVWLSIKNINNGVKNWKIRWDRLFTTVGGEGEPKSYLSYFLMALAAYYGFEYFRKKKQKNDDN